MNFLNEQLTLISTQFHWLRPLWLLALIPALLLGIFLWKQKRKAYQWQQLIAPELLPFLLDGKTVHAKKSLVWGLLLAWVLSCIAIAGPSWIKRPMPVEKNQNALVILLDLSYSMISEDIKPSRIARAQLKIADVLRERKDGQTALVVYAADAHTVTPISDDSSTIVSLLSSLTPNIMPQQGSNTEDAIARGIQLLHDAGASQGDLLLITDGVVPEAFDKIQRSLAGQHIQLSILGVGTNQPAPIPGPKGGFLRDDSDNIITTQLNSKELAELAQRVNGRFHEITNNKSDIDYLKPRERKDDEQSKLERDFDQWIDQGQWIIFLLLPIALFCFRRGLLLSLLLVPLISLTPSKSYALGLDDIWLTKDQQAQRELSKGDAKKAAEQFESPEWKASAQYRAGDYAGAADAFAKIDTANGRYNQGNALAKAGKLDEAMKAYDEALKRDPNLEDAKKNRTLVEKLKQQQDQKKDQDKNKDDKNKDNKDQKDKDQQDKDKQDQNKQDQDKQDQDKKDQQDKEQQDKDQKEKEQQEKDKQENKKQDAKEQYAKNQKDQQSNSQSSNDKASAQQSSAANQAQADQGSSTSQQQVGQTSSAGSSAAAAEQQVGQLNPNNMTTEQKQALEQWLRRVPDDPAGLLRNKFRYQYQLNRQKEAEGNLKPSNNNADQRL